MSSHDEVDLDLELVYGSWDETEALLGQPLAEQTGVDPVNARDIRRRLEVLEWNCPLHYDYDLARELGHPSPPSPVTMLKTWAMPAYWQPGMPRRATGGAVMPTYSYMAIPAPGSQIFATNIKTTYHQELYEGDTVTGQPFFKALKRKATSVGDGAFVVIETAYRNQRGELVATEEFTFYRFDPPAGDA